MGKKKILFIEDEFELVELMKIRLKAWGYQMLSAYDGEEGLEKVQQENPDLILLDIILPKIDGLILCRRLKKNPKSKRIPIIVVSAAGGKDLPARCKAAGADDLVIKPYESAELLAKIKAQLKK